MRKLTMAFSVFLLFAATACLGPAALTPQQMLVGEWESIEIGDDSGNIVGITLSFKDDGSFSATMEMYNGSVMPRVGKYWALESDIIFTIDLDDGLEPIVQDMTYSIKDGLLAIFDSQSSGWGKFKRVK